MPCLASILAEACQVEVDLFDPSMRVCESCMLQCTTRILRRAVGLGL